MVGMDCARTRPQLEWNARRGASIHEQAFDVIHGKLTVESSEPLTVDAQMSAVARTGTGASFACKLQWLAAVSDTECSTSERDQAMKK